jgi:HlyD family secretion protein
MRVTGEVGVARGVVRLRLGAAGALALALAACGRGEATEAPTVQTGEVVRQDLRITAEATGQLEPIRQVEVKSKASGEVLSILVDTGDEVEAGALLARVEPRDVENAFNQAQADLDVARARLDIARSQLERSRQLLESGVITEQENEARVLEFANAQAALVRGRRTSNWPGCASPT